MKIENMLQRFSCISFLFKPSCDTQILEKLTFLQPEKAAPAYGGIEGYILLKCFYKISKAKI